MHTCPSTAGQEDRSPRPTRAGPCRNQQGCPPLPPTYAGLLCPHCAGITALSGRGSEVGKYGSFNWILDFQDRFGYYRAPFQMSFRISFSISANSDPDGTGSAHRYMLSFKKVLSFLIHEHGIFFFKLISFSNILSFYAYTCTFVKLILKDSLLKPVQMGLCGSALFHSLLVHGNTRVSVASSPRKPSAQTPCNGSPTLTAQKTTVSEGRIAALHS